MSGAVRNWKRKLAAARASREAAESGGQTPPWGAQRAAWFDRFAGKRDDRSHTYRFMKPYVRGHALEIGPGAGAYTHYLLDDARSVTAVEASPYMADRLRHSFAGHSRLRVVESRIEDWLDGLEDYDFALAANVLAAVERIDEVLQAVTARACVFAIVMWSGAETPEWARIVEQQLLGRRAPARGAPDHCDLLAVLEEMGLPHESHRADVPEHTFTCRSDVVGWALGSYGLEDARRPEMEAVLGPLISEHDGKFGLLSGRETHVVIVHGKGSPGSPP